MIESTGASDPLTFGALKAIRNHFALWYFSCLGITLCASGVIQIFTDPGITGRPQTSNAYVPGLMVGLLARIVLAGVLWYYSGRIGMPATGRAFAAFSGFVPLLAWVGVYAVAGYTPPHLRKEQEAEDIRDTSFPAWIIPTVPPLVLFGILTWMNPQYMAQLFLGPPIGATIPATPIPCGWPILLIAFLCVALADIVVWFAYNRKLVRGGWMFLLIFQVIAVFEFPAIWIILLGPAAVQVYKQFFGGNGSP